MCAMSFLLSSGVWMRSTKTIIIPALPLVTMTPTRNIAPEIRTMNIQRTGIAILVLNAPNTYLKMRVFVENIVTQLSTLICAVLLF